MALAGTGVVDEAGPEAAAGRVARPHLPPEAHVGRGGGLTFGTKREQMGP